MGVQMNLVALRKSRSIPLIGLLGITLIWSGCLALGQDQDAAIGALASAAWASGFGYLSINLLRRANWPKVSFLVASVLCALAAFLYFMGITTWKQTLPENAPEMPIFLEPLFMIWAVFELATMWLAEMIVYTILNNQGKKSLSRTFSKVFGVTCLIVAGNGIFWAVEGQISCSQATGNSWCGFGEAALVYLSGIALIPLGVTYLILKLVSLKKPKSGNDSTNL